MSSPGEITANRDPKHEADESDGDGSVSVVADTHSERANLSSTMERNEDEAMPMDVDMGDDEDPEPSDDETYQEPALELNKLSAVAEEATWNYVTGEGGPESQSELESQKDAEMGIAEKLIDAAGEAKKEEEEEEEEREIKGDETSPPSESATRSAKSAAEESNVMTAYSTRGRHQREAEEEGLDSVLDRKSAMEEEREAVSAAAGALSFLESLGEEERRTRTRYLPDVDGFHALHKSEVKSDLALARSVVSSAGVTSTLSTRRILKGKKSQKDEDQMEIDDEQPSGPSEDERASEILRASGQVVDLDNKEFPVPSSVFVTNGDEGIDCPAPLASSQKGKDQARSPYMVETLTAFNPPRPPESVGAKKKHRMLRWERRPQDVEVDLTNYRKTVQRTREELRNVEKERERIQTFGAILRVHYREQLEFLNEESIQLNEELGSIQTECVSAADLITSRTRSKGAGQGSYRIRDVISVLKARGGEVAEKGLPACTAEEVKNSVPGLGGITPFGFIDWNNRTAIPLQGVAIGWTLPGERVQTPYGDGVVLHVFGPSALNVGETLPFDLRPKPAPKLARAPDNGNKEVPTEQPSGTENVSDETEHSFGKSEQETDVIMETDSPSNEAANQQETPKDATADPRKVKSSDSKDQFPPKTNDKKSEKASSPKPRTPERAPSSEVAENQYHMDQILKPRVAVQLQFGVGFFLLSAVHPKENSSLYSDAMLAARWKKIAETALLVGSSLDVAGMEYADRRSADGSNMDIDEVTENENIGSEGVKDASGISVRPSIKNVDEEDASMERFVPFGATMLPTSAGRGSLLAEAPLPALEAGINEVLFSGGGVLGSVSFLDNGCFARTWYSSI